MVLTVALVMAAMMVVMVAPAFATITPKTSHKNGGGNTPQGNANGVPVVTVYENPAGHQPGGWNN
jgi:hypothetical protein